CAFPSTRSLTTSLLRYSPRVIALTMPVLSTITICGRLSLGKEALRRPPFTTEAIFSLLQIGLDFTKESIFSSSSQVTGTTFNCSANCFCSASKCGIFTIQVVQKVDQKSRTITCPLYSFKVITSFPSG